MNTARAWLAMLARLGPEDLRRISRLVDLLVVADRATKATADAMLDAPPAPATAAEARARADAVIAHLTANRRVQP